VSADGLALGTPELFLRTPAFEVYPAFSPDGRWIAYSSNEAGTREIYVRRFPAGGRTQRVSSDGGRIPQWSTVRPELFYQTEDMRLMVTSYRVDGDSLVFSEPRRWTTRPLAESGVFPAFDVAADGRVATLLPLAAERERQSPNHVSFILNFGD